MNADILNDLAARVEAGNVILRLRIKYQARAVDTGLSRNERSRCTHYVQVLDEVAAAIAADLAAPTQEANASRASLQSYATRFMVPCRGGAFSLGFGPGFWPRL